MDLAVVFQLDAGLRRLVEKLQGQLLDALEHGHQPSLDRGPEVLLLPVLVGRIRECSIMLDPKHFDALLELSRSHCGPTIRHRRPGQASLLDRLRIAVNQRIRRFVEVPLQVARQPRPVVEDPQELGGHPDRLRGHDLPRPFVEVQVPQAHHEGRLEAPDLSLFELLESTLHPGGLPVLQALALGPPATLHEPPHCLVRRAPA